MSARMRVVIAFAIAVLSASGCHDSASRLHAPPQGATDKPHALQANTAYMLDNAMLHDMSIADIHFVPHTTELNGLGMRRLNRYVELLAVCGGTLHYETYEADEEIVNDRIENITTFLADAGADMEKVKVEAGMSRGRGMRGREALEILEAGTDDPVGAGATSVMGAPGE